MTTTTTTLSVATYEQMGALSVSSECQGEDAWPSIQEYVGGKCGVLPSGVSIVSVQPKGGVSLPAATAAELPVSEFAAQGATVVVQLPEGARTPAEQAMVAMQSAMKSLQQGLEGLGQRCDQLHRENGEILVLNRQFIGDISRLTAENQGLQREVRDVARDNKRLRQDLILSDGKANREIASLQKQTKQLQREVGELRSDRDQLRVDKQGLEQSLAATRLDCVSMKATLSKLDRSASAISVRALVDRVREIVHGHPLSDAEKLAWNGLVTAATVQQLADWGLTRSQLQETRYGHGTAQQLGSSAAHLLDQEVCAHAVTALSADFRGLYKFVFAAEPEALVFPNA